MDVSSPNDEEGFIVEAEVKVAQLKQRDRECREQDLLEEANAIINDWLNNDQICNDFFA